MTYFVRWMDAEHPKVRRWNNPPPAGFYVWTEHEAMPGYYRRVVEAPTEIGAILAWAGSTPVTILGS